MGRIWYNAGKQYYHDRQIIRTSDFINLISNALSSFYSMDFLLCHHVFVDSYTFVKLQNNVDHRRLDHNKSPGLTTQH
jgi:hypothetical protein